MGADSRGATATVAAFAVSRHADGDGHAGPLGRAVLDTVGSALAGTGSPPEAVLRRWSEREGSTGSATVWTTGESASAANAALCNGTAAHALDWDDVSPGSAMHPSAVLVPALLAMAEEEGASGAELVQAHDVGAAVFRAVAQALPAREHYRRGWHTTSTVGRLAAVGAVARLVGLDEGRTRHALGLVASQCAGALANFGTMTKPLHAGLAARDAVMSVRLAEVGFTANASELEAAGGFFDVYGDPSGQRLDELDGELWRWRREWPSDWAQKRYPACYATHRAIDAALELRAELGGRRPRAVRVTVEPGGLRPLIPGIPLGPTEAKFSMAYVIALALLKGDVRLTDFTAEAIAEPDVATLCSVVSAVESEHPPVGEAGYRAGYSVVEVEHPDGRRTAHRIDTTYGDASRPLTAADLDAKFAEGCAAAGVGPDGAGELAGALTGLPGAPGPDPLSVMQHVLAEREAQK